MLKHNVHEELIEEIGPIEMYLKTKIICQLS